MLRQCAQLMIVLLGISGCREGEILGGGTAASEVKDLTATEDSGEIPAPITIKLLPENPVIMAGDVLSLQAFGYYPYDGKIDLSHVVAWESLSPASLEIISGSIGLLQTNDAGEYEVSVSYKGVVGSAVVKVETPTVKSIWITGMEANEYIDIAEDGSPVARDLVLTALATRNDMRLEDVSDISTWSSSNADIAKFEDPAIPKMTVLRPGEVDILVERNGVLGKFQLKLIERQKVLERISLSHHAVSLPIGAYVDLTATGHYSNGSTANITNEVIWGSTSNSVANISNDVGTKGRVQAASEGLAQLSASLAGLNASIPYATSNARLDSIDINPKNVVSPIGVSVYYTLTGNYSDGNSHDLTSAAEWTIVDAAVANLSNSAPDKGKVSGASIGSTNIRAAVFDMTVETAVTVSAAVVTSLRITGASSSYAKGRTAALAAIADFSDGTSSDITEQTTWNSSNSNVVPVSNNTGTKGQITAQNLGSSVLTSTFEGIIGVVNVSVLSPVVDSIVIQPQTGGPSVAMGLTKQLNALGTYSDGTTGNISTLATWGVDLSGAGYTYAASVSNSGASKGRVTSFAEGVLKFTASYNGQLASLEFTVTEKSIQAITVNAANALMETADTQLMSAIATYSDGSTADVTNPTGNPDLTMTWSSNAPSVVSVSNGGDKGTATAVSEGSAAVSALLVSVKFGVFSNFEAMSVQSKCVGGTRDSYYCLRVSALDQSCSSLCSANGGSYHSATHSVYGAGAANALRCDAALQVLSLGTIDSPSGTQNEGLGLGCARMDLGMLGFGNVRYTSPATNAASQRANARRVCACTQ